MIFKGKFKSCTWQWRDFRVAINSLFTFCTDTCYARVKYLYARLVYVVAALMLSNLISIENVDCIFALRDPFNSTCI